MESLESWRKPITEAYQLVDPEMVASIAKAALQTTDLAVEIVAGPNSSPEVIADAARAYGDSQARLERPRLARHHRRRPAGVREGTAANRVRDDGFVIIHIRKRDDRPLELEEWRRELEHAYRQGQLDRSYGGGSS